MTHCDRILALLSDGQEHPHHELYGLFTVAHSRISDLRKRGHRIELRRDGDVWWYRLGSLEPQALHGASDDSVPQSGRSSGLPGHSAGVQPPSLALPSQEVARRTAPAEQLTLA